MKCVILEEHSSSCFVYYRVNGTLFPVSMIDGEFVINLNAPVSTAVGFEGQFGFKW